MNTEADLQTALEHHRTGRLDEAIDRYRKILAQDPNHPDALHLMGMLVCQRGDFQTAINLINRAIAFRPNVADFHNDLGLAYLGKQQLSAAIAAFRTAIRVKPDCCEAFNNLGVTLQQQGQMSLAAEAYAAAVRIKPDYADARRNLGNALKSLGRVEAAVAEYRAGLAGRPNDVQTWNDLGSALRELGRFDEAEAAYRKAVATDPNYAQAHNNLGNVLKDKGLLEESIRCYRRALELRPESAAIHNNLGNVLAERGDLDQAIESYRRAVELEPGNAIVHGSLLLTLHYHPDYHARRMLEEHRAFDRRHGQPLKSSIQPHRNGRDAQRRLRIGYVSPNLCDHAAGRFLLPLLQAHDRGQFEVFCYADVLVPDTITARLRAASDQWRNIVSLNDQQTADLIRNDAIDILVDLAAHSAGNRLVTFARKPAPVQVAYLAYCSTTGLEAIDYRLTDPYLDPPGVNDEFYSEKSVRLRTYWCYQSDTNTVALPQRHAGPITFGSLNNFAKVTAATLELWRRLLNETPNSRLILHSKTGTHRSRVEKFFADGGVDPGRIEFVGRQSRDAYFAVYNRIDIGLDAFPYSGGTTTCDAMWMGVPVVTLVGQRPTSRGGWSILSQIGLTKLAANSPDQYVQIARDLANDPPRLAELRRTLRQKMQNSPLMDTAAFAADVEKAYREMWRNWCGNEPSG